MTPNSVPKDARSDIVLGFALAIAAAVLWSFIGPLSKKVIAAGISPLETAFWRAFLGGGCFAAQAILSRKLLITARDAGIFLLFGLVGVGILFSVLQVSIQLSGAATAMMLLYTAPVWVALASRYLFHEIITIQKFFAITTALVGAALICLSGGSLSSDYSILGIICGLVSGITYASHFPFYVWWGRRYSIETIYTYMLLGGAVALFPFTPFVPDKGWDAWSSLLALSFLTTYAAYLLFAESLKRITQIQAAVVGNIEPLLATLWVWLFFDENFNSYGWIGCGLIVAAVFFLSGRRKA